MKKHLLLCPASTLILLPALASAQQETDVTLSLASQARNDVDFRTLTTSLGVKAKTPYGLVLCDSAAEKGMTRIDTFDDVFGINTVRNAPWRGYEADRLTCGYGLKFPLLGGELSGGLGIMRQEGETTTSDEGKEIELSAFNLKTKYERGDYSTAVELVESRFDLHYHHTSSGFDSDTSGRVRKLNITGEWGPAHAELGELSGDKDKAFTTPLFPAVDFDYQQVTVSLGPSFKGGVLRYVAPTYVSGSERGSFNELDIENGVRGAVAGMRFGETKLRLSYLSLKSGGTRDYSPVTTDLAEERQSTALSVEIEAGDWSAKLANNRSEHHGFITASAIPYTFIVGCATAPCDYDNVRDEDEWQLSGSYRISEAFTVKGELYQRGREDRQYEYATHRYTESGGSIHMAVTF